MNGINLLFERVVHDITKKSLLESESTHEICEQTEITIWTVIEHQMFLMQCYPSQSYCSTEWSSASRTYHFFASGWHASNINGITLRERWSVFLRSMCASIQWACIRYSTVCFSSLFVVQSGIGKVLANISKPCRRNRTICLKPNIYSIWLDQPQYIIF